MKRIVSVLFSMTALAVVMFVQNGQAQSTQTPWQNLTPEKMTAVWWQWAYSVPAELSPWPDTTGGNAASGQPYFTAPGGGGSLFFLAGTTTLQQQANGDVLGKVTRSVTVKQGTAFFFPTINSEWDNVGYSPALGGRLFTSPKVKGQMGKMGVPVLGAVNAAGLDTVTENYATLTPTDSAFKPSGKAQTIATPRLQSPGFAYKLPATGNVFQVWYGIDINGTVAPVVSDGWWGFVPAEMVVPGHYLLKFGGSFIMDLATGHTFTEDITYQLTVTP